VGEGVEAALEACGAPDCVPVIEGDAAAARTD
jgi:hypothetical protein